MQVLVNGEEFELAPKTGLLDFLEDQDLEQEQVVIEYNGSIIKGDNLENIILEADDQLELISFVGGG
ncbi:MAG: sulfur carrier protein ThiS [Bacillota bacterium]